MRLLDRWFSPAPAERLGLVRALVGAFATGMVIWRWHELTRNAATSRLIPVGVVHWLQLDASAILPLQAVTVALGVAFTLGLAWRFVGPAFAACFLYWASWKLSWGAISHDLHVATLHVVALAFTPAAAGFSLDRRLGTPLAWIPSVRASWHYGWPLRLLQLLTAVTYLLAGWAKVGTPRGLAWADGDNLLDQIAYARLVAQVYSVGDVGPPAPMWIADHAWILGVCATGTLALELGAPIALLGGRVAWAWSFGIVCMHQAIRLLMGIAFPFHAWGLVVAPFLPLERVLPARWRTAEPDRPTAG